MEDKRGEEKLDSKLFFSFFGGGQNELHSALQQVALPCGSLQVVL
jgi:hypothetical protein